jgi:cytochrome P450
MIIMGDMDLSGTLNSSAYHVVAFRWDETAAPAMSRHRQLDELRNAAPVAKVDEGVGFVLISSYEDSLSVAQNAAVFPQTRLMTQTGELQPLLLIPEHLDGAEHAKWRRLLGKYFSPRQIAQWDDHIAARANTLIDGFIDVGRCDFVTDFALRFPTVIFLEMMGLPTENLDEMLAWETVILHPSGEPGNKDKIAAAAGAVVQYFATVIAERRAMPVQQRPAGIVTEALDWTIDDKPIPDQDLLSFYLMMFVAGLDTVTAELGYAFLHLAEHPADRQVILDRPDLIPRAVEELLRLYPIVIPGREAAEDTEIAGCPIRKGEVVMLSFPGAGRDENRYTDALIADFTRSDMSHLSFGAGPHRCLGSHLARREMEIAYREWHRRIPNYHVAEQAAPHETVGVMMTLNTLPLEWDVTA